MRCAVGTSTSTRFDGWSFRLSHERPARDGTSLMKLAGPVERYLLGRSDLALT